MNDARKDREQLRQLWAARIADDRASGLTMARLVRTSSNPRRPAERLALSPSTQNHPSLTASTAGPRFLPLTVTEPSPTLTVRVGSVQIDLKPGFDPQLLKVVVRVLEETPCSP